MLFHTSVVDTKYGIHELSFKKINHVTFLPQDKIIYLLELNDYFTGKWVNHYSWTATSKVFTAGLF